jgi:hypothetical protein
LTRFALGKQGDIHVTPAIERVDFARVDRDFDVAGPLREPLGISPLRAFSRRLFRRRLCQPANLSSSRSQPHNSFNTS